MSVSEKENKALRRSETLIAFMLKLTDKIPNAFSIRNKVQEPLNNINSAIQGLRSPRIMVIGRSRSGKSSLINAICGFKVAEISDTKPETGTATWKEYYHHGTELLKILDTRGLQESEDPRQTDSANTPYESLIAALRKDCPDVVLFLCKASEVYSASNKDLDECEQIVEYIKQKYRRNLPIIGVLTKCDELSPPMISLPTNNERKNRNIEECVQSFYAYLKEREKLRDCVKSVVPTVAYAEYEEGENGLVFPDEDYRWNIDQLVEKMISCTPKETRGSLARMAHLSGFQRTVARTIVTSCSIICGVVAANPIPGLGIPTVAGIQSFMVSYIAWIAGREFSAEAISEFVAVAGTFGVTDIALKFIPGFGSLLSAGINGTATQFLGETAINYFFSVNEEDN